MKNKIAFYRQKIMKIDAKIIKLLKLRFLYVKRILKEKIKYEIKIENKKHENKIIKKHSKNLGNYEKYIVKIYKTVINQSKLFQKESSSKDEKYL